MTVGDLKKLPAGTPVYVTHENDAWSPELRLFYVDGRLTVYLVPDHDWRDFSQDCVEAQEVNRISYGID